MNSMIDALTSIGLNHPASIDLIQSTTKNLINHSTNSDLRQSVIILLGKTALADSITDLIALKTQISGASRVGASLGDSSYRSSGQCHCLAELFGNENPPERKSGVIQLCVKY
jgi:hypothetical protein